MHFVLADSSALHTEATCSSEKTADINGLHNFIKQKIELIIFPLDLETDGSIIPIRGKSLWLFISDRSVLSVLSIPRQKRTS